MAAPAASGLLSISRISLITLSLIPAVTVCETSQVYIFSYIAKQ
jgi:hypothetical protein